MSRKRIKQEGRILGSYDPKFDPQITKPVNGMWHCRVCGVLNADQESRHCRNCGRDWTGNPGHRPSVTGIDAALRP